MRNDGGNERERRQFKCKWLLPGAIHKGGLQDQGTCWSGGCCATWCLCHYQLLTQDMHISPTAFGFVGGLEASRVMLKPCKTPTCTLITTSCSFERTHEHMLHGLDATLETYTGFWFRLLQICPKESQVSRILVEFTSRHNAHHHLPPTIDCPSPWILSIWENPCFSAFLIVIAGPACADVVFA